MLVIGTPPESIETLGLAIMAIITASCDEKTKRVALETLKTGTAIDHTSISNCNFTGK
jgi:hypothetical protein